ncbi:MAG TPA: hypothetical protein PKM25_00845, partial [Candidatus Ozemobacteraceae bacterium]|nr:hypothetical protein [Candidatus Ozemobacteraceae bacterium]
MTDSRDARSDTSSGPESEDLSSLARQIDELSRQRERLIASLRPAGGLRPPDDLLEQSEQLKEENRRLKERVSRLLESDPEALLDQLHQTERTLAERNAEIQQLRRTLQEGTSSSSEIQKRDLEIERLKLLLADMPRIRANGEARLEEIQSLKINLADSVLEQKQLGLTNHGLLKQIAELKQEIYQHQGQVRDLSMRLDLSKRNEQALSEQEKQHAAELIRLRATSEETAEARTRLDEQYRAIFAERGALA